MNRRGGGPPRGRPVSTGASHPRAEHSGSVRLPRANPVRKPVPRPADTLSCMGRRPKSPLDPLLDAPAVREAAAALVNAVAAEAALRALTSAAYARAIRRVAPARGRALPLPPPLRARGAA